MHHFEKSHEVAMDIAYSETKGLLRGDAIFSGERLFQAQKLFRAWSERVLKGGGGINPIFPAQILPESHFPA